jgi:glutathione-regulated potassium-efflux system protein KefB
MAVEGSAGQLVSVVTLLAAAVVAVPLFKRLGLGSVLGYLAAGLAIGPFGFGLFSDPHAILHIAELGVVMFLFIIGLEMRPSHLWSMRGEIFGLGSFQVILSGLLLTGIGMAFGFSFPVSFVCAMGFVLTSTAIVMQLLGERGDIAAPRGQKIVAILLFEDLLIVPLLAIVAFMAPQDALSAGAAGGSRWVAIGLAVGALVVLIVAGRCLLNPVFRILANARAREVMTAAALLVVLGAALLMQLGGLSMAMGAFLAGVLLSESAFRHQLEADVEPFRGLLLGLFFLGVGMALDLSVIARDWPLILAAVLIMMAAKALCIYTVARLLRSNHADALDRAMLMAQGGEFAFVLFGAALASRVIDPVTNANITAVVVLSMAFTPLVVVVYKRFTPKASVSLDGVEAPPCLTGNALIIGFGRFGQIASQHVVSLGADIAIIDNNPERIRIASEYGHQVYYGDGTRMDVLHAAGAHTARIIMVCIDHPQAATQIVQCIKHEFPHAKVLARAFDRMHMIDLSHADVDWQVRETFESAILMGREANQMLGATQDTIDEITTNLRRLDAEKYAIELANGIDAGKALGFGRQHKDEVSH